MSEAEQELLAIFRDEVVETLDALATGLEALRGDPGAELKSCIDASFRHAHNLKGAARMVGQTSVVELTHAMEDRLSGFRDEVKLPPKALLDKMLRAVTMIQHIVDGGEMTEDAAALAQSIREPTRKSARSRARDSAKNGNRSKSGSSTASRPRATRKKTTKAAAKTNGKRPDPAGSEPGRGEPADAPAAPPAGNAPAATPADAAAPTEKSAGEQSNSVRVDVDRLDHLMSHIGEMPVIQARLAARNERYQQLADAFVEAAKALSPEDRAAFVNLNRRLDALVVKDNQELATFGYLTDEIINATKRVRMMPLSRLSAQWRRIVRESAQEVDKDIQLHVNVGEIELDKHILDSLRDPFMHLLRNAVDHGIELPEVRRAAGKPPAGNITIGARLRGTQVAIEVSDDGAGLDAGRVGRRAVEKGLINEQQLAAMSEQEVLNLVFAAGFSTADRVSQLSGRGVGLDVVRKVLRDLGAEVSIAKRPERSGTTFLMTVPASLVSTRGLLVEVGGTVLALPIEHVERTLIVSKDQLITVGGGSAVSLEDGTPLELRWLDSIFGRGRSDAEADHVVIVRGAGGRLGIVVSKLLGEEEFVTKPLPWNLRRIKGVSGAVVRADGTLAAVVEVGDLLAWGRGRAEVPVDSIAAEERTPRILVVDDSLTSRTLEKNILEAAGYDVAIATDGEEGWETLQSTEVDLVVSDVEMPRCTGLELAGRIRSSDRWRDLPLILVTSLGKEDDLAAGARVGADEYIVKGQFDQRQLLDAVARLV